MTPPSAAPLSVDDVLTLRRPAAVELAPGGDRVVFVVHAVAPEPGAPAQANLWVANGDQGSRPLTAGPHVDAVPRVAPDGRRCAFASDRAGTGLMALYVIDLDDDHGAGDPRAVAELAGSVEDIRWSAGGDQLLVLTADEGSETGSANGGTAIVRSDDGGAEPVVRRPRQAWRRLHLVDIASGSSRQVGPPGLTVWELGWDGLGPAAAVVSTDPSESGWYEARIATIDLTRRRARTVYAPRWQVQSPTVSPDGAAVAFVEALQSDRGVVAGAIVVAAVDGTAVVSPLLDVDVSRVRWLPDGRLFWVGVVGLGSACGFVRLSWRAPRSATVEIDERWRGIATLGMVHQIGAACSDDGARIVAVREGHGEPPELAELTVGPTTAPWWRPMTTLNAELAGRSVPEQRVLRWAAPDGVEIEGLLLVPVGVSGALPLVVYVHGGPTNAWTATFAHGLYAGDALGLAQDGFAVLLPNPRGSTGRGATFMQANLADMGGGDLEDLLAGVRALVADGAVDPARVGITGASYGGFMAAWAAVRSDAFAAAVPVSSVSNWLSFHLTTGVGRFDELFLAGSPYESDGPHLRRSPVMYAPGCAVPTLVLHGDADLCTPVGQAHELYQALAETGCEVELAIYPRGGHDLIEREHLRDANLRTRAWMHRHLRAQPEE